MSSSTYSSRTPSSEVPPFLRKRRSTNSQAANRTVYALAYPAPVFTDKTIFIKHLRPRLYLQLQRRSADGLHYEPFVDVVSLAPPKDPRRLASMVKKYVKKLKTHERHLHFDKRDVLLVCTAEDTSRFGNVRNTGIERVLSRFEDLTDRKVAAVLRTKNRIVTEDGRAWVVSKRTNGSFEFSHVNAHGGLDVARWVPSKNNRSSTGGASQPRTPMTARFPLDSDDTFPSFNFSLIDPSMRRHAVLATLDSSSLQIKDTYYEPVTSTSRNPEETSAKVLDEATRTLILATAVWLDLHLGWSPSYKGSLKC